MIKNLTHYQETTLNRLQIVKRSVELLELFFEIGYRTKQDVYTQLIIHFPKYNTNSFKEQFRLFWNFKKFELEMINDLEAVLSKINAL